jgi:hypothetical protein
MTTEDKDYVSGTHRKKQFLCRCILDGICLLVPRQNYFPGLFLHWAHHLKVKSSPLKGSQGTTPHDLGLVTHVILDHF